MGKLTLIKMIDGGIKIFCIQPTQKFSPNLTNGVVLPAWSWGYWSGLGLFLVKRPQYWRFQKFIGFWAIRAWKTSLLGRGLPIKGLPGRNSSNKPGMREAPIPFPKREIWETLAVNKTIGFPHWFGVISISKRLMVKEAYQVGTNINISLHRGLGPLYCSKCRRRSMGDPGWVLFRLLCNFSL